MKIQRKAYEGEFYPRGYGYAWHDWHSTAHILYPIPFNIILRKLRDIYHRLRQGLEKKELMDAHISGFRQGEETGKLRWIYKARRDFPSYIIIYPDPALRFQEYLNKLNDWKNKYLESDKI